MNDYIVLCITLMFVTVVVVSGGIGIAKIAKDTRIKTATIYADSHKQCK